MLRQINDFLGPILLILFAIIAGAIPIIILIFSVLNAVRRRVHWIIVVAKAFSALLAWLVLTYAVVLIFMMVVFSASGRTTTAQDLKMTGIFIVECVIYTLTGLGLIWWVRRNGRNPRVA